MSGVLRPVVMIAAVAVWCGLPMHATAQDLALGTWTGTVRNAPPRNPNPRPASLVVKKGPDPHWRWRGGAQELLGIAFTYQQTTVEVGELRVADGRLSYSFADPGQDGTVACELKREADGSYAGECKGKEFGVRLVTLSPPEPDPAK